MTPAVRKAGSTLSHSPSTHPFCLICSFVSSSSDYSSEMHFYWFPNSLIYYYCYSFRRGSAAVDKLKRVPPKKLQISLRASDNRLFCNRIFCYKIPQCRVKDDSGGHTERRRIEGTNRVICLKIHYSDQSNNAVTELWLKLTYCKILACTFEKVTVNKLS